MTLPKNKRRNITVDGRDFHWTPGRHWDHGHIVIQDASGTGARIIVDPIGIMRPADVAAAIRFAVTKGWLADSCSGDTHLGFVENGSPESQVEQFVVRSADAGPYWKELGAGAKRTT